MWEKRKHETRLLKVDDTLQKMQLFLMNTSLFICLISLIFDWIWLVSGTFVIENECNLLIPV